MNTDYLLVLGHFLYFGFLVGLILQTWANFVLAPINAIKHGKAWSASPGWAFYYISLWALALTIPMIPSLVGGY